MAGQLEKNFEREQKVWVKLAMKGRPLHFGLQAKAAKAGKFLLSKKSGEVKPARVKELIAYSGKDADKKNKVPGGASCGVAVGKSGTLTLYFEKGKALPVAEKFVKHFVSRELKYKLVKKVVIAEADVLPVVPEESAEDNQRPTTDSIRQRAEELATRVAKLTDGTDQLQQMISTAIEGSGTEISRSDDLLDQAEFLVISFERLHSLTQLLNETGAQPGVATEVVDSIRNKRLAVALAQLQSGDYDNADDNLDVAEQSILNLRNAAGIPSNDEGTEGSPEKAANTGADEQKESFFRDWLEGIKPEIRRLHEAGAAALPEIATAVKTVSTSLGAKDWQAAADGYRTADALITSAVKAMRSADATASVTEGRVGVEVLRNELKSVREAAVRGIAELMKALKETEDEQALQVVDIIRKLATGLPQELESTLTQLDVALTEQNVDNTTKLKAQLKSNAQAWAVFLNDNADYIRGCENNPWNIRVSIVDPIQQSLKSILKNAV